MVNIDKLTSDLTAKGFTGNRLEISLAIASAVYNNNIHNDNQLRKKLIEALGREGYEKYEGEVGKAFRDLIQNGIMTKSKSEGCRLNTGYNDQV